MRLSERVKRQRDRPGGNNVCCRASYHLHNQTNKAVFHSVNQSLPVILFISNSTKESKDRFKLTALIKG